MIGVVSMGQKLVAMTCVACRRKNDSDMHYQALQAEYSEGLLARQVRKSSTALRPAQLKSSCSTPHLPSGPSAQPSL